MATTTSITTTYAGEAAGQYISPALLSGSTIANGGVTVKPNVKFKEVIKKLSTDAIVKDATCDFDATSTITMTERVLQPEFQQVNLQLCKKDFISDWEAISMGYSAHHDLPPSFSDYLISYVAAKVADRTERSLWAGDTANNGQFNGITSIVAADAALPAAQEIAGTTVTSSNVIAELGSIVDAIPSTLYGEEDMFIYVSQNIARAYVRALGGFGASGLGAAGTNAQGTQWWNNGSLSFDGVKLFVANGLGDNDAIATTKSNLFFGTGLLADHNEVKVLDMSDLDGSDNVRVVMRFTAGAQVGVIEDVVTYGIANSAN
jgi:hypothetical protein